jgi:hypothetical protein
MSGVGAVASQLAFIRRSMFGEIGSLSLFSAPFLLHTFLLLAKCTRGAARMAGRGPTPPLLCEGDELQIRFDCSMLEAFHAKKGDKAANNYLRTLAQVSTLPCCKRSSTGSFHAKHAPFRGLFLRNLNLHSSRELSRVPETHERGSPVSYTSGVAHSSATTSSFPWSNRGGLQTPS